MRIAIAIILLSIFPQLALAEGPPIENGKVTVPHTIINLTKSQIEEVEVLGSLTLTSDQWEQLRKIGPYCPKRFDKLITTDYHDCTCGMPEYVVLLPGHKAAILHDQIDLDLKQSLDNIFTTSQSFTLGESRYDAYHQENLTIRIDSAGRYYFVNAALPYTDLLALLSKPQQSLNPPFRIVPNNRTLHIITASPLDDKNQAKLNELCTRAKATGWTININGNTIEDDKQIKSDSN